MKKTLVWLLVLLIAAVQLIPAIAAIKVPDPGTDFYYLDTANVLSEETEGEIYFCNQLLEEKCGAQIVVAALDSIDNADIYDFAVAMGNSWGIGSSEENNGFLLLMAIEEDDYYALPGRGLDGIFPASIIKEYYDDYLETDFAAKNYDAGARNFFEAIFQKVADYYNADVTVQDGIQAYKAYEGNSASYGGAQGKQNASSSNEALYGYSDEYEYEVEQGFMDTVLSFVGWAVGIIAVIILLNSIGGGRRRHHRDFFFMPFFAPRPHHRPPHPPRPPRPHAEPHEPRPGANRRPPHSGGLGGFGGFGGGHGGGGSFHGGGGFGGGHGSGGGGFGGGAGRGRH